MEENKSSYQQIFKATSLFGGVQLFNIIFQVIRSKFIAVLLGPEGMGIAGLLTSTTGFISGLTNFGLGTSAVKNISEVNNTGDPYKTGEIVSVLKRLTWITGIFGTILVIILSPWLSQLAFGNKDYTLAFIWISVILLLNQISTGQTVVMQGMRKLKYLAKSSLTGAILGLIVSVPLYYFFGIDGIVPAIILTSLASLIRTWYFVRKVPVENVKISNKETFTIGKNMLTMGFFLSLSGLITLGVSYIVRIYISRTGGVDEVGFYNAGIVLINSYVGMVFTAMGTDYYPRLSEINEDHKKVTEMVNQQASIAILILAPIVVIFITYMPFLIQLLYSAKFLPVVAMVTWAIIGMYFRGASWSMGFIVLAKGDSKVFLRLQVLFNAIFLTTNILGYTYYGITGVGISVLVNYILHFALMLMFSRGLYHFNFSLVFYRIFIIGAVLCLITLCVSFLQKELYKYLLGSLLTLITSLYAYWELNKRVDLKSLFYNFLHHN